MCIACWLPKSTNKRSEYVIVIAFLEHQWLHEGTSLLRYIQYIACLFILCLHVHKTNRLLFCGFLNFVSQKNFSFLFHCPLYFPFLLSILLILGLHGRPSVRSVGFSGRTTHNKNLPTFRKMVQMLSAG